ncbi:LysR family transcriptional regulator [Sinorhizobium meliloti]|uniref:LysR family transcriptional regulator n=1 Tax=Rhizobium meliloti TaxID=382 RepID=UPI000FDB3B69|nr:LysR family transcriptional regulator [Sinorhizobium meliloti]RVL94223.1 LysR family transcriptional regulator [Sinorhizobium meliloti]
MDRNLRAFLSVARKGNLTAASEEIGLTQPAVTKTIRRLESELGVELFSRTARGMFLNGTGKRFLQRAEAIENQYRFAAEEMAAERRQEKAVLRIVAGVAYQSGIAARFVSRLHSAFPRTMIELRADLLAPTRPELMRGDVDIILGALVGAPPEGIVTHPLLSANVVVFAGPLNPLHHQEHVRLVDTTPYPWVLLHHDDHTAGHLRRAYDDLRQPPPHIGLTAHTIEACLDIVGNSKALTAAVDPVRPLAHERGLRMLPLASPLWSFDSGIWVRASSMGLPIIQRAIEILDELCMPLRDKKWS